MSGNQRKKKRIWWIAGACVLAVVLIAVGVGVGVRLAAPSGPAETAAGADPAPSTPEGLPRVDVSGAQGCLVDRVWTETLVEAYKKIQNPPEAAGAVELAGFMTAYLVTASQDEPAALLEQSRYAGMFTGQPWDSDAWEEFLQYRSISQPSHEFALTNARYWVSAADESEVSVIVVGPYTSYGAESDDSASLPLAGMQYTITADDGTWKIAKAQAFSEADHGADTEQILAEGGEFSDPC